MSQIAQILFCCVKLFNKTFYWADVALEKKVHFVYLARRDMLVEHNKKMVKGNFLTNTVLYKTAILNGNKVILFPNLLDFYMKFIVMLVIVIIYT